MIKEDSTVGLYWYVLKVKVGFEKKVASSLLSKATKLGLTHIETSVFEDLVDGKSIIRFPGIVLLRSDDLNSESQFVSGINGLERFVSRSPISDEEYNFMGREIEANTPALISVGSKVEIVNGAFATQIMTVSEVDGENIKGLLNIFERETEVIINSKDLVTI